MSVENEKDWKVTTKQKDLITKRIEYFSRKEATLCINIIEAIYRTRPSNKIPTVIVDKDGIHLVQTSKSTN